MTKLKVAIVGTQGLPAKYGGFETLVDFLAQHLSSKLDITIYCSAKIYNERLVEYKGCSLKYISLHANGFQSIPYDILSIIDACRKYDKILILGSSGGIIMPLLGKYKDKFILNFGGLDWQRSKWNYIAKKILKLSEKLAINFSKTLIADNEGIAEYIKKTYGRESHLIAYGGDQVMKVRCNQEDVFKYKFLANKYAFCVARIQPDNNIDMILKAFSNVKSMMPIVLVGNWSNSAYGIKLKEQYMKCSQTILLDAIYDQRELDLLRSNCNIYIHGHSAGGTNPSLVEAMMLSLPVFCYRSGFNEYTTENKALYFSNSNELSEKIMDIKQESLIKVGNDLFSVAEKNYRWEIIADKYFAILK